MSKYAAHDHYVDEAYGLLKNKLGITDEALLEQVEADYAAVRSFELSQTPITGVLSSASLQYIHRSLFGDVYEYGRANFGMSISAREQAALPIGDISKALCCICLKNFTPRTPSNIYPHHCSASGPRIIWGN